MSEDLTDRDKIRYDRQMMIADFDEEGQEELKSSKALIAGAGGLGSPVSIYLAVAGLGSLRLVDNDEIELSNLNRQILYMEEDIEKRKAEASEKNLKKFNQDIDIESIDREITEETIDELVEGCDLIVDCLDNYPTRYIINKAAVEKEIPIFHAAVHGMRGQATTVIPGDTPCLKCIVPSPPPEETFPVLGATPGLLACIQVHEVIKHIVGIGASLKNKLLIVEKGAEFETLDVSRNLECEICGTKERNI